MSERGIRKGDRYKWWVSDRSGFEFGFEPLTSPPNAYTRESGRPVYDKGILVSPDEFDQPPPSTRPLGGEGEIGTGARANSNFATDSNVYLVPQESIIPTITVNSSQSVSWNKNQVVYIVGNLKAQVMSVNPQVQPGQDGTQVCYMCVGSSVTFTNGSGLSLHTSSFTMNSGSILNLIYNASNSLWYETSRGILFGDLGAL